MTTEHRQGIVYGLLAYGLWGVVPIYFRFIMTVPPAETLLHRIVWSATFLAIVVTLSRRWRDVVRVLRTPKLLAALVVSAALISTNWLLYIHCVNTERIADASLGYFITPMFSVLIGFVFLRERVRPLHWLAILIAAYGCVWLAMRQSETADLRLALLIAVSFSLYGFVRKLAPVDGLLGLMIETLVLSPVALVVLAIWHQGDNLLFGSRGWQLDVLLVGSGVVTALPLLAFGQAARRLPLSTLGFMQFFSPTIQFAIAVLLFGEKFDRDRAVGFAIVWIGVAVFLVDLWRARRPTMEPMEPE